VTALSTTDVTCPLKSVTSNSKKKCVAGDFGQEAVVFQFKVSCQDFCG
jgi:hypothetical protein